MTIADKLREVDEHAAVIDRLATQRGVSLDNSHDQFWSQCLLAIRKLRAALDPEEVERMEERHEGCEDLLRLKDKAERQRDELEAKFSTLAELHDRQVKRANELAAALRLAEEALRHLPGAVAQKAWIVVDAALVEEGT